MFNDGYLIIGLRDLSRVQKRWTLEDIGVFEKMLYAAKKAKRGEVRICKKALQVELRIGRKNLEKSLGKLSRAGLIVLLTGLTYNIGSIQTILSEYYIAGREDELKEKLKYYLGKTSGKFDITRMPKKDVL